MKKIALVHSIILIAALAACAPSITVTSDWDPAFDFSQSKTFVLLENDIPGINRFIEQRVTAAITAELSSKGLQQVNTVDDADLAIGFDVATENRTTYRTTHSGFSNNGWHSNSAPAGACPPGPAGLPSAITPWGRSLSRPLIRSAKNSFGRRPVQVRSTRPATRTKARKASTTKSDVSCGTFRRTHDTSRAQPLPHFASVGGRVPDR